ncbi:MAG TPA: ABC transporter ATP-binding protein, partial [Xylanibacter oryzae]|nr:ABC transporter ATP-binding protein [Xylanibacter oryzae]
MNKIEMHAVLPQVFSQRTDLNSEIWQNEVLFEKNHLYLVEADSGKGKST